MSLWSNLMAAKKALNYMEELSDPAAWKKRTNVVNALTGIICIALPFVGIEDVDPKIIDGLSAGISAVWMLWNLYFTTATSKKVGL